MVSYSRRKYRRFALRYRIRVKVRSAGQHSLFEGVTRNISAGGLLLESPTRIPKRSAVSFTIIAQGGYVIHPIAFAGKGKVVRIEPAPRQAGYAIALKCVRPIQFHPFELQDKVKSARAKPG